MFFFLFLDAFSPPFPALHGVLALLFSFTIATVEIGSDSFFHFLGAG